jgi:hypothetical protein
MSAENPQTPDLQAWFAHGREHLETYYYEVTDLNQSMKTISINGDLEAVLGAAESLNCLSKHVEVMRGPNPVESRMAWYGADYPSKDVLRIEELALATSQQLEMIADRMSWGEATEKQLLQVTRNLPHIVHLLEQTLSWLDKKIT